MALAAGLSGAPAQAAPGAAAINAEIDGLSAEVDQLEGARAVRKLQRAFGYYVDRGLWDEAADLFADDGTIEVGMDGVYVGKARIREYLQREGGGKEGLAYGQLNEHLQLQPKVDVAADGLTAKGRWRELEMLGHFGQDAFWGDGIEENAYVKEGGVWKIKSLHLYVNFVAPYEGGWARMKRAPADWRTDAAKAFPPDRPPTATYRPFPEPQVPPFHYANPVTGRVREDRP
ncbi:MAG: nuclear transport factor 2 family protein [Caulobacteraceae bacterium]